MADEILFDPTTAPASEPVSDTAPEQEAPPADMEEISGETLVSGDEGDDEEIELVAPEDAIDFEYEGKQYVLPKELEAAFLRQDDYTKKTTSLAEARKEFEAQQMNFGERARMQDALLDDITAIKTVDARLQEYNNIDWQAASQQNPQATQAAWIEFQQLRDFRTGKEQEINYKIEQRRSELAAHEAKLLQETVTALKAPKSEFGWPGHTPAHMQKVAAFSRDVLGIPPQDLGNIKSALPVFALNLSMIGYQYLQSLKAKTARPSVVPEPVSQVPTNKSSASFDPMKLPMDKWVVWERKRMAKKRAEAMNGR